MVNNSSRLKCQLFFLLVLCSLGIANGQSDRNIFLIDSLQKNVLNSTVKDSSSLAQTHYTIGEIYRYSAIGDSSYYHYYKAEKIYRKLNYELQLAKTLYGIAVVLTNEKYYTGAEVTSFEAIKLLDAFQKNEEAKQYKSFLYNNLGIIFKELEDYETSIDYCKKALGLKEELKGDNRLTIIISKNNLANSYKSSGQYDLALSWFSDILKEKNLLADRPDYYALILDNYAHSLYLSKNYEQLPSLYIKALNICDSIDSKGAKYNSISINQNLAEYYKHIKKNDSAKYYAYKAKGISEQFHNDGLLNSLLLLSKIEADSVAVKFYDDYITLSDSLQKNQRVIRNKFARIRFETNQVEKENEQIAREFMWLFILSIALVIGFILVYVIITQRNKNKELKFIQQQQETNEEIYNLMLSQQEKIDEARATEKRRVSQELHDGVLGRLFGTRLSLDSLNMSSSPEAIETRSHYIGELKTIEEDIRKVSHELNTDFISGSGFIDIIKALVEKQTKVYQLKYKLNYNDSIVWEDVTNKTKIHIYRIIQETLHNIHKHAGASIIKISFELKKNVIYVSIIDDGVGFDFNKAKLGIGLKNINSRIKEIGGNIKVDSEKNTGTTLLITIPIN
jgi:two-component system NarL family sensor kinase